MSIRGRVYSAARAKVIIDGKRVGWCTRLSVRERHILQPVRVLDTYEVASIEPTGYDVVSVEMGTLTIVGESLKSAGYYPKGGNSEGARLRNALDMEDLTMAFEDSKTSTIVCVVRGLRFDSNVLSVDAGNISGTNVTGMAIEVLDASEL